MKFTCIGKGHGAPCLPATKQEWEALRRESWLAQMCARIERGDEQLKHRLPVQPQGDCRCRQATQPTDAGL